MGKAKRQRKGRERRLDPVAGLKQHLAKRGGPSAEARNEDCDAMEHDDAEPVTPDAARAGTDADAVAGDTAVQGDADADADADAEPEQRVESRGEMERRHHHEVRNWRAEEALLRQARAKIRKALGIEAVKEKKRLLQDIKDKDAALKSRHDEEREALRQLTCADA